MVVVDEPHETIVDALVVRHVRVWGVDAGGFADDFRQRTLGADEIVVDLAGARLIAVKNGFLQPVV